MPRGGVAAIVNLTEARTLATASGMICFIKSLADGTCLIAPDSTPAKHWIAQHTGMSLAVQPCTGLSTHLRMSKSRTGAAQDEVEDVEVLAAEDVAVHAARVGVAVQDGGAGGGE